MATLEALLANDDENELDTKLAALDLLLLTLDLLLLKSAKLDEVFDDEIFELDSDEIVDAELTTDELEMLVAMLLDLLALETASEDELDTINELADEETFDVLLLIAALELIAGAELELNTIFTEDSELDIFTLDTALDIATIADDIELLLFSARLLKLEIELLITAAELALLLNTELPVELEGIGAGELLPPPPPPQALSSDAKIIMLATKKYGRSVPRKILLSDSISILFKIECCLLTLSSRKLDVKKPAHCCAGLGSTITLFISAKYTVVAQ